MNYQWRDLVGSLVDGKYPLVEYLGEVGENGVFATDAVNGTPSIIRLAPGSVPEASRLLEQWRAATALSHPGLAGIFAAGETEVLGNTVVFTVTERPDDSLAEAVSNRALNQEEARLLSTSVLGGLSYLHRKGFAHNAVAPENIVAMGENIKLAPWTIARASRAQISDDVFAAGQTIVEVLTQKRPASEASAARIAQPFHDVARACLRRTVDAGEALTMLEAAPAAVAPKKSYKLPTAAIVVASLAVAALVFGVRSYKTPEKSPPPVAQSSDNLPSPVNGVVRQRAASPPPTAAAASRGDWVVVAEIYKQHDQAMKRAEEIATRWKQWRPEVYPPQPDGRRFMVVLGFANTRREGEQLLAEARSAGMPRNVYLTRLKR